MKNKINSKLTDLKPQYNYFTNKSSKYTNLKVDIDKMDVKSRPHYGVERKLTSNIMT